MPTLVIHWKSSISPTASDLFKDRDGNPLDRGLPANGDGHLVTLGYFTAASASGSDADLFAGDWVPLTSGTAVGDSSSGYGYGDGMFSFTTVFTIGADTVQVYPYEPAGYAVNAPQVITTSLPPPGHPIAIRFHDRNPADASALYNTVSDHQWKWPTVSSSIPVNLYLKASNGTPTSSKWLYGSIFENPSSPFRASLGTEVTLVVNAGPGGTVTDKNGTYNYGQNITIEATPEAHMEFVRWEGDGVAAPTFNNTTVSMTDARSLNAIFQVANYMVTLSSTDGDGDLNGSGSYPYETIATITASPHAGYDFAGWQGTVGAAEGLVNPNLATTTTEALDRDRSYVAVFSPESYLVEANATFGGNYSLQYPESGQHRFSSSYDLNATPWRGHSFTGWTSETNSTDALSSPNDANATLTVTGPAKFTANFVENLYKLTVAAGAGGTATPTTEGFYPYSQQVPVTTTPATGYNFSHWSGDLDALKDPYSPSTDVNMTVKTTDVSLQAHFTPKTYPVEINATVGGSVTLATGPYEHFGVCSITAEPDAGYVFTGWQGETDSMQGVTDANAPSTLLTISGPVQLTANFALASYNLTVSAGTGGAFQGGGTYRSDQVASISAIQSVGHTFTQWSGDVGALNDISAATTTVNMGVLGRDVQLVANFASKEYTLTANVSGTGDVNGTQTLTRAYSHGDQVVFPANPATGWSFDHWSWSGTFPLASLSQPADLTHPSLSLLALGASDFTAHFTRNSYSLVVEKVANGDSNGSGQFLFDTNTTIAASPYSGYTFSHWSGDTATVSNPNSLVAIVRMPDHNLSLTPVFSPVVRVATTTALGKGSATGGGSFPHASSVTVTAIPTGPDTEAPRGYFFKQWDWNSSSDSGVTSENPYNFSITSNISLTATFEPISPASYTLVLSKNFDAGGTTSGAGYFDEDNDRPITATPNPGYTFLGWSSQDAITFQPDDGNATALVNLDGNSTVTAHFATNVRKLGISAGPGGSTTSGGTSFSHGHTAFVTATPDANHTFAGWNIDKNVTYSVSLGSKANSPSNAAFLIDGRERPEIALVRGFSYAFDVNTNDTYPFYLSTLSESSSGYEGEYTEGVVGNRATQGTLTFTVPTTAPDLLFYHSPNTTSMGSPLRVISLTDSQILPNPEENTIAISLLADFNLTASFSSKRYPLTVDVGAGGSLAVDPTGEYEPGTVVTVTANPPDEHYRFKNWQGEGIADPSALSTTISMHGPRSATALYEKKTYRLSIEAKPVQFGDARTENNELEFPHGTGVSLVATPNPGNSFTHWSGASVTDPFSSTTTYVIDDNASVTANFQANVFRLDISRSTLNADGSAHSATDAGGTVTSGDSFSYGEKADLQAVPSPGYEFVEWQKGNVIEYDVSVSSELFPAGAFRIKGQERPRLILVRGYLYKFKPDGNSTIGKGLHFSLTPDGLNGGGILYAEGITGSPSDSGVITLEPTDSMPNLLYYAAEGNPGFGNEIQVLDANLTETGLFKTSESTTALNMFTDMSVAAVFRRQTHTVSYDSIPSDGGFVSFQGENPSEHGSTVTLTATPSAGYRFVSWSGDDLPLEEKANPTLTLSVTENRSLLARFVQENEIQLTIEVSPEGAGWTTGSGRHEDNPVHSITASPNEGYRFVRWEGVGVVDANATATTMDLSTDRSLVALFEKVEQSVTPPTQHILVITLSPAEGGLATGANQYDIGTQVAIAANPNPGYRFLRWQGEGVADANATATTVELSTDRSLVALFEKVEQPVAPTTRLSLVITVSPPEGGLATGTGQYDLGEHIAIAANPNDGYRFQGWQGEGVTDPNATATTVNLSTDRSIVALFEKVEQPAAPTTRHVLAISVSPPEGGLATGAGQYDTAEQIAITANPNAGYRFQGWQGEGVADANATAAIVDLSTNRSLVALFEKVEQPVAPTTRHILAITVSPPQAGQANGAGQHDAADRIAIAANPNAGYRFQGWQGEGVADPNATATTVDLSTDRSLVALFEKVNQQPVSPTTYVLVITIAPPEGGEVSGAGQFESGTQVAITANPKTDYRFQGWQGEGVADANALNTTVALSTNLSIVAVFEKLPFDDGNATPAPDLLAEALASFDPIVYLARNPDLKNTVGNNLEEARKHFVNQGFGEGRPHKADSGTGGGGTTAQPATPPASQPKSLEEALAVFDPVTYLTLNPDLASHFGSDLSKAKDHFLVHGLAAGRAYVPATFEANATHSPAHDFTSLDHALQAFDATTYLALNPEVAKVLGGTDNRSAAKSHFIHYGFEKGLSFATTTAEQIPIPDPSQPSLAQALETFDPATYLKVNSGLASALGNDLDAATEYFIDVGHSLGDIYQEPTAEESGGKIPAEISLDEALQIFDPAIYLAENADLTVTLGKDLDAAQKHFVEHGFEQGREFRPADQREDTSIETQFSERTLSDALNSFEPEVYLALNPDLQTIVGSSPEKLKEHYLNWGHRTGRPTQPEDLSTESKSVDGGSPPPLGLFSLSLTVFPAGSGSVNGAGAFGKGSTRVIEASPQAGYLFLEWRGQGIADRSSAKTTATLSANTEIIAVFHYIGIDEELPAARLPGSAYVGWDWWQSHWFGSYWHQAGNQWIYHANLGWIYLVPYSEQSVWMWSKLLGGWHWTTKDAYPFLRDYQTSTWLWFNAGTDAEVHLFFRYETDRSSGNWETK